MKTCPTCNSTYPTDFTLCPRDGGQLQTLDSWSTGTVVCGKYRIMGPVGVGGMATVYKAEHIHFREIRALKVIGSDLSSDDNFVRRFMQEAVLTRRLQHPNAVRVDDIDRGDDGRPFIVMEFIDGVTLRDAMTPQIPIPTDQACRIARQVGSALYSAHQLGLVHRDIKPANIVLSNTPEGQQAKVLDFGIATVKESRLEELQLSTLTLTSTGLVIGTPAYMSPEQAAGKRGKELDGRSDLYSLGIVFYQMLSGELPLQADSDLQLLMAHLTSEPVPLQQRRPDLPPALVDLVMKCLAKDPDQRPSDAQAFVAAVGAFESQKESEPDPSSEPHPAAISTVPVDATFVVDTPNVSVVKYATLQMKRLGSSPRRKPYAILALVLCALSLAAVGVWSYIGKKPAKARVPVAPTPVLTAKSSQPSKPAESQPTAANPTADGNQAAQVPATEPLTPKPSELPQQAPRNAAYRAGHGVSSPIVMFKAEPKFTPEAKSFKHSGTSLFTAVVDENGTVQNIRIVRPAGYGLDQLAMRAISTWRFRPGLRNGVPVRVQIGIGTNFHYAGLFSFARSTIYP